MTYEDEKVFFVGASKAVIRPRSTECVQKCNRLLGMAVSQLPFEVLYGPLLRETGRVQPLDVGDLTAKSTLDPGESWGRIG